MIRKVTIPAMVVLVCVLCLDLAAAERPGASSPARLMDEQQQIVQSMTLADLVNPDSKARLQLDNNCRDLIRLGAASAEKMRGLMKSELTAASSTPALSVVPSGISGFVKDLTTGLPPFTIPLMGAIPVIPTEIWAENDLGAMYSTLSNEDGSYFIEVPPGTYKVWTYGESLFPLAFSQPNHYLPQWYNSASSSAACQWIDVLPGQVTPNIDFHLSEGGVISGNIIDQETGAPIPLIFQVFAYNIITDRMHFVLVDITLFHSGYRITGLESGEYLVVVVPMNDLIAGSLYDWEVYNNQGFFEDADPVKVTTGVETLDINFYLTQGGRFAGRVRDAMTDRVLPNASVVLFDENWVYVDSDMTNCNGRYRLEAPHLGIYYLYCDGVVDELQQYYPEYFRNRATQAEALPVLMPAVAERIQHVIRLDRKEGLSKIGGLVWNDADNDGVKDPEESGLPDVVLHLCPAPPGECQKPYGWAFPIEIGEFLLYGEGPENVDYALDMRPNGVHHDDGCAAVLTDEHGNYLFKNIPVGHWQLSVSVEGVPTLTPNPVFVDVADIDRLYTIDFGFGTMPPPTPVLPPIPATIPAKLVFVKGSPAYHEEGWDKAVDGDLDGWDGTATVRGDQPNPHGPAWAIFAFSDSGSYKFDGIGVQTENGEFELVSSYRFRERMAHGLEVLVSTTSSDDAAFVSIKKMHKANGELEVFKLDDFVLAKYVKLIITDPLYTQGGWRQIVEFMLMSGEDRGVKPAAEKAALAPIPGDTGLDQNYPNPFNPATTIRFHLAADASVSVRVFDLAGREIARLADGEMRAGVHEVTWHAGQQPSGVYFVRLQAGNAIDMRRIVLMK